MDMSNKYDYFLKELLANKKDTASAKGCLSEELFAAYLGNLLNDNDKIKVEEHLSQCSICRQQGIAFSKVVSGVQEEALQKSPRTITERAKQLMNQPQTRDWIEVVLKFAKHSIQIIKDSASVIQPLELIPAGIRTDSAGGNKTVFMKKEFNGILAGIAVENIDNAFCDIDVQITDSSNAAPLDNIRLTFISGGKELASYLTVNGRTSFKNTPYGSYLLIIMKGNNAIGEISLKLEHD